MRLLSARLGRLIRRGTLTLIDVSGRKHVFAGSGPPSVAIRLHSRRIQILLALDPGLYLGKAYMDGALTIESGGLDDLMEIAVLNRGQHSGLRHIDPVDGIRRFLRWAAQLNPIARARRNVAHHYDLSNSLYGAFLDSDLQYSCGYFLHPDDDLEAAQQQKKAHIAAKLCLRPGQRVLDIGCGWGGLAAYLNKACETAVTGITLSREQLEYARARTFPKTAPKPDFRLLDYRQVEGKFDRIVSIGMFEHVGLPHYGAFFRTVRDHMTEDGIALIHTIGRPLGPDVNNAWISKYIFPGAYVPALSEVLPSIERAGLLVTDIEILRLHYAKTLRAWRERFAANRNRIRSLYDERFCRMWDFYLAGVEVAFRHGDLAVFQIQLARQQDAAPLTRDYIGDHENRLLRAAQDVAPNRIHRAA